MRRYGPAGGLRLYERGWGPGPPSLVPDTYLPLKVARNANHGRIVQGLRLTVDGPTARTLHGLPSDVHRHDCG